MTEKASKKYQSDLLVNISTGILKGMKIIGSPSSLMDYMQKNKNAKKRQKF